MQLVTTNLAGNLHVAAGTINRMGLADFVISGSSTVAVFRVSDGIAPKLRAHLGTLAEYQANPVPETDWSRQ